MCKFTSKLPYSPITLQPRSKEDRDKFWAFRCQDIAKMMYVEFIIFGVWCLQYIATVIDTPAYHSPGQTLSIILILTTGVLAVTFKRRGKEHFVYLLLIFMALFNFYDVCHAEVNLAASKDDDERIK